MSNRAFLRSILPVACWFCVILAPAQPQPRRLALDSCMSLAEKNYPQIAQYELLRQSNEYTLDNAERGKLPQVAIKGQATYQSDVTGLPGGEQAFPEISKDQYQLYGEITQPLTGISVIDQRKKLVAAQLQVDEAALKADLYQIRQRVSDLFFGILLLQGQLEQTRLAKSDLEAGLSSAEASVQYGIALKSTVNILRAESLTLDQRLIEQEATKRSFLEMLGRFVGEALDERAELILPPPVAMQEVIRRPELNVFEARLASTNLQHTLLDRQNLPNFNLFLQTGIGRPALNFLDNSLTGYYLGGIRLNWNLASYYTSGKEKQIYSLHQELIKSERETFLFNTRLSLVGQSSEIQKMSQLLDKDREIIVLREEIVETAVGQLENGVITATDYATYVNDADKARQALTLHEIELLQLQYNYKITSGN